MAVIAASSGDPGTKGPYSSVFQVSKRSLSALKNKVNTSCGKLADAAISILELTDALSIGKSELEALAIRVVEVTKDILGQAAASPKTERLLVNEIGRLQSVVEHIGQFFAEQEQEKPARASLGANNEG